MHHDLRLVGTGQDIQEFRAALVKAGARHVDDCDSVHLEWQSDGPAPVESLAAEHPNVDVRLRRMRDDHDEVQEVSVVGGRVVIDRHRRIFRESSGEVSCEWGLSMDEDGDRLDRVLLRRMADDVLHTEHAACAGSLATGDLDALALAKELGAFADAVKIPFSDASPDTIALAALRRLASLALTIACAETSKSAGEIRASRIWRMREVVVHAGAEELWSTPGDASWPEWVRYVVGATCSAVEACHDCSWSPVTVTENGDDWSYHTPDKHRAAALGGLVSTCIQTLALFECARV